MNLDLFLNHPPYQMDSNKKNEVMLQLLNECVILHREKCMEYEKIFSFLGIPKTYIFQSIEDFPYLPVRLFKHFKMSSIDDKEITKILTSSGTTGTQPSKIYLDKATALNLTKSFVKIMQDFVGPSRHPMIIVDSKSILKNPKEYSARGAGILGMSTFGRHHFYLLKEDMSLDIEGLKTFLNHFDKEPILIFGFTSLVWAHFYKEILKRKIKISLPNSILFHSGGWKKLKNEAVDNNVFKKSLEEVFGIKNLI